MKGAERMRRIIRGESAPAVGGRAAMPPQLPWGQFGPFRFVDNATAYRKAGSHAAVHEAIKNGVLVRPERCELCNWPDRTILAHHWDYERPLDVEWVCPHCHSTIHRAFVYYRMTLSG